MNQNKPTYSLKPLIRANKNFIYKNKKYPIDFILVAQNSNYFFSRRDQYDEIHDIVLPEEHITISEDSIHCFISSCQNEFFDINDSNVLSLHHLSIKYEVPCLLNLTDQYIKEHDKSLIFQSIQYKYELQNSEETNVLNSLENDENTIAINLFDYIDNEQLVNLPIPVLYRIINNPRLDFDQLNQTNKKQLIDFLFKCLKRHKKEASVLFVNLNLENQRVEIFSKLINEYSDVFDFSMINSKFLMKTTTDLLSELSQLKQNYSNSISQIEQLFEQLKSEKQKQQELKDSLKKFLQEQLKNEHDKLNKSFEIFKEKFNEEEKKLRDENAKNFSELKELVNQNNEQERSFITKDV